MKSPHSLHVGLAAAIAVMIAAGSANAQTRRIVRFQKLSDFPVSVDSTGWSALFRVQNWMILKETTSPADSVTVINVSNPANPQRVSSMSLTVGTVSTRAADFGTGISELRCLEQLYRHTRGEFKRLQNAYCKGQHGWDVCNFRQ